MALRMGITHTAKGKNIFQQLKQQQLGLHGELQSDYV